MLKRSLFIAIFLLLHGVVMCQLTAAFTYSNSSGCTIQPVQFTDQSNGGATTWLWDFGNQTTSTLQNPSIQYLHGGTYNVTLTISNGSLSATTSQVITVAGLGPSDFTYTYTDICNVPADIRFTATNGDSTVKFRWLFDNGDKGLGDTITHRFTTLGSHEVQLVVLTLDEACTQTITKTLSIGSGMADFTAPETVCANASIFYPTTSNPTPLSYSWQFSDGSTSSSANPQHAFATAGIATITMTASFGSCTQVVSKQVTVLDAPVVDFSTSDITKSCQFPQTVTFNNATTGAVSYNWNFGEGTNSSEISPVHTFNEGRFNIALTATGDNGCSTTNTKAGFIFLGRPIISGFKNGVKNMPDSGCLPFTIKPIPNLASPETIASYSWNFGDGNPLDATQTPTHIYPNPGNYDLSLTVITTSGCTTTYTLKQATRVGTPVTPDFTVDASSVCFNEPITFTEIPAQTFTSRTWDFGDGSMDNRMNPVHTYKKPGDYTVILYASNNGCSRNATKANAIHVKPPLSSFTITNNLCQDGINVQFADASIDPLTWSWDFGDGTFSTDKSPFHKFPGSGKYVVKLTTTNGSCSNTFEKELTLVDLTNSNFIKASTSGICVGSLLTIAVFNPSDIRDYLWNTGDQPSFFGDSVITYAYTMFGTYNPSTEVTYINGCKDTFYAAEPIYIYGPSVDFDASTAAACKGDNIIFTDKTVADNTHPIVSRTWTWGDGKVLNFANAPYSHTYNEAGAFDVKLWVLDTYGCVDSLTKQAVTISGMAGSFTFDPPTAGCDSTLVKFTNTSSADNSTIASYNWNFGDGFTSTESDPSHFYQRVNTYPVVLTVTNAAGCDSTIRKFVEVDVNNVPKVAINAPAEVCDNSEATFKASNSANTLVLTWKWDFANGDIADVQNTDYTYTEPGTYVLSAIGFNTYCSDTAYHTIVVHPLPPINAGADVIICRGASTILQATGGVSYTWKQTGALSCLACDAPTATPPVDRMYYVTGVSEFACEAVDSVFVEVKQPNTVTVTPLTAEICDGDLVQLAATGAEVYSWQPPLGLNSTDIANPAAMPNTNTTYTVTGTDTQGCFTSTANIPITVNPRPDFNILDSFIVTSKGSLITLTSAGSPNIVNLLWQPTTDLSCTTCPNPQFTALHDVIYSATATTAKGCKTTDKVTVHVLCEASKLYMPSAFTPNGDNQNDRYYPISSINHEQVKVFSIYNRSGQILFSRKNILTDSFNDGWDGKVNGVMVPPGTYIYRVDIMCEGKPVALTGTVTLIR